MANNASVGVGADQLLLQAEKLLLEVTGCIKPSAPRNVIRESEIVNDLLLNPDHKSFKVCDPESDLAQIEWLLRGVPEAYDSEPHVDDEMVMALLKEGGNPPTQLVLPSIYATNQMVLEKLSLARVLRISFTNLLVLSVRYGVRKEGTFIRVFPPCGCNLPANEAGSIMIPLPELKDRNSEIAQLLRKNDKRDSLRNYFVGAIDLNKSYELELTMSEKVVREWIHGTPTGALRIELYGYLAPHATSVRGSVAEAMLLASAVVPLGGLLGTASLDAVVHCDLSVDAYTHAMVLSRMRGLSFGQGASKQTKSLGPKLGTATVRVSILSEPRPNTLPPASDPTRDHQLLHEVHPLMLPVPADANTAERSEEAFIESRTSHSRTTIQTTETSDRIHSALAYVPSEYSRNSSSSEPTRSTRIPPLETRQSPGRSVYGPSAQVNGSFALALCGIEGLSVPVEKAVEIQQAADSTGVPAVPRIGISYKISPRDHETVTKELDLSSRELASNYDLLQGRMYYTDMLAWTAPVMEVWLCWTALDPSPAHSQHERGDGRNTLELKYLLGLARYPANYKLGSVARLPIGDATRGVQRGLLVTAAVLGREEELVETSLQCLLNFHTLDRRGALTVPPAASTSALMGSIAGTVGAPLPVTDSAETAENSQQEGVEESKDDSDAQDATQDPAAQEERVEIAVQRNYELDDSIGDIISFLNEHDPQEFIAGGTHSSSRSPPRPHPLAASTSSINEFLARERDATADVEAIQTAEAPMERNNVVGSEVFRRSAEGDLVAPKSSAEVPGHARGQQASLHLLDFSVDGVFSAVRPTHSAYSSAAIFGCYVKYSLPDLLDPTSAASATATGPDHALWWDGDCAVLNGSLRHQIELDGVSAASLGDALGLSSCIKFYLHLADAEGNIPPEPVVLGEASLPLRELAGFMNGNTGFAVLPLPISLHQSELPRIRQTYEVVEQRPELFLKVSHRIEPVLLRRSIDPAHFAVEKANTLRTSIEQPPWRLRYDADVHSQSSDPSSGPGVEQSHLFSSSSPTSAFKQSGLLGFELTQQDLDGMMYFRDPSAPLPWVPFEASEPESRPVLTTALGGRAITVREGEEVDLDAALKKSIYELEYIGGMFGHRAEHLPVELKQASQRGAGWDKDRSGSGSDADSDTEMYKSDFESLDDAGIIGVARALEREAGAGSAATPPLDESGDSGHSQYFSDAPPAESEAESEDSDVEAAISDRVAHLKFLVSEHFKNTDPVKDESSLLQALEESDLIEGEVKDAEEVHEEVHNSEQGNGDGVDSNIGVALTVGEAVPSKEGNVETPNLSGGQDLVEEVPLTTICARVGGDEVEQHLDLPDNSSSEASLADLDTFGTADALGEEEDTARWVAEELRLRFDSPGNYFQAEQDSPQLTPLIPPITDIEENKDQSEHPEREDEEEEVDCAGCVGIEERFHGDDALQLQKCGCSEPLRAVECATQTDARELSLGVDVSIDVHATAAAPEESKHSLYHSDASASPHVLPDDQKHRLAVSFEDIDEVQAQDEVLAHYSLHFSVHTDPDASDFNAIHESAADLSALSSTSGLNRSTENTHALDSSRDNASAATVPSTARRAYLDELRDDSPDTSKIKNIVDKQIEKFFGAEVLAHPAHPSPPLGQHHFSVSGAGAGAGAGEPDSQSVHQWWNRIDSTRPAAPLVPAPPAKQLSEADLFRANLSKVQALLPVGVAARGGVRKHPGWQGRFLDKETDRASNIMNNVFNKSDYV